MQKSFSKLMENIAMCANSTLKDTLAKSIGIIKVEINYITNIMMVQYDPDLISNIDLYTKK